MTPHDYARIGELFLGARRLESDQRAAWLEGQCADALIRGEVVRLLNSDSETARFPSASPVNSSGAGGPWQTLTSAAAPHRPERIGRYLIRDVLGEGGMGIVYRASQENPRREVAVKLIRPGLASASVLRRFEHEAHLLGRLKHPGIAQIYDADTADCGFGPQPYFAMELVSGPRLTEFAESRRLTTDQRLTLLIRICDAVQHAHQKGVIHRDLKPANILVADEAPPPDTESSRSPGWVHKGSPEFRLQPKILDFGVARAVGGDLQSATLHTEAGQIVGTIPYMSPEQIAGDSNELDTRSDVYSLGVVAFELLTGRFPYEVHDLPIADALCVVRDREARSLGSIDRRLRGDLETVVAKALEKDRSRRYASASELAADLQRILNHEPITARPSSVLYQLRKFARRNRGVVSGMGAAAAALVIGAAGFAWQAEAAQREATKAGQILSFLQNMITAVDPFGSRQRDGLVRTMLDDASCRVTELAGEPLVQAGVQRTIGDAYRSLGLYEQAEPHLRESLSTFRRIMGDADVEVGDSLYSLAFLMANAGQLEEAAVLYREALAILQKERGEHPLVALCLTSFALLEISRGNYDDAERLAREAHEIQSRLPDHPRCTRACTLNNLANALSEKGAFAEAEDAYRESLAGARTVYGEEHPEVAAILCNLGTLLRLQGNARDAEPLLRQSVAINRKALVEHPFLAWSLNDLALVREALGDHEEARSLLQEALEMNRRMRGEEHLTVSTNLSNLGRVCYGKGDYADAEPFLRDALAMRRKLLGDRHWRTSDTRCTLGACLTALGRYEDAESHLLEGYAVLKDRAGLGTPRKRRIVEHIAELYEAWGREDKARLWRTSLDALP